ncbi:MAG: hypothetical protein B6229_05105 [Spirochaetaceae bacterium 4572_7]|nr:MAG: hypothetical protein B6229_05105 [Spirochaetaceae bacterium 4572_7]
MLNKVNIILIFSVLVTNIYGVNTEIYSKGSSSAKTLALFLYMGNESLGAEQANEFANIYREEAKAEGINWDVAFVQMCLETGFLKYGGLIHNTQNNYCGLGSFDGKQGASFSTIREGVRAHVQHLKAYSSFDSLNKQLVDPRFGLVRRGSATNVIELAGLWAEDTKYGHKLISLLKRVKSLESRNEVFLATVPLLKVKEIEFNSIDNENTGAKNSKNINNNIEKNIEKKKIGWLG